MKFLHKTHNPQANPKSKKLVDTLAQVLFDHGMTDKKQQAACSLAFFQSSIKLAKNIVKAEQKGENTDPLLEQQEKDLRAILGKYGYTDEEVQDDIIMQYLSAMMEVGECARLP